MSNLQPTVSAYTRAGLKAAFQFFDANSDGRVSAADLGKAITDSLHKNLSDHDVLALLQEVCGDDRADQDGGFDFSQFITYVVSKRADGVPQLKEAFALLDGDEDGQVTRNDLSAAMAALGWTSNEKNVEEIFLELDLNGDGTLDLAEFS